MPILKKDNLNKDVVNELIQLTFDTSNMFEIIKTVNGVISLTQYTIKENNDVRRSTCKTI